MYDQRRNVSVSLNVQVCIWGGNSAISQIMQSIVIERLTLSGCYHYFGINIPM